MPGSRRECSRPAGKQPRPGNRFAGWLVAALVLAVAFSLMPGVFTPRQSAASSSWSAPETVMAGVRHYPEHPSIATDPVGNQHVVFRNTNGRIYYANNSAATWSDPVEISRYEDGYYPSIAIHPSRTPVEVHVAYTRGNQVRYVNNVGGSWMGTPETASADDTCSGTCSLAVDTSGYVHIAYESDQCYISIIKYNARSSVAWGSTSQRACDTDENCYRPSLALDSSGDAHVAYRCGSLGDSPIRYNNNAGASWGIPVTVSPGDRDCDHPSLAVDPGDSVHVSYSGLDPSWERKARYVNNVGGSWMGTPETASGGDGQVLETSTALDPADPASGVVYIAYRSYHDGRDRIRCNSGSAGSWGTPLTGSDDCRQSYWPDLTCYDGDGHLAYVANDTGCNEIMYTSSPWTPGSAVNISSAGDPPQFLESSLAYDDSGDAHLAAVGFADGVTTVFHSTNASGTWSAPSVVSGDDIICSEPSIATDPSGFSHVAYRWDGGGSSRIRYVNNVGGAWAGAPETATGADSDCGNPFLRVDSSGDPRLVYAASSQIRYVEKTAGAWSASEVPSGTDWNCGHPSMVLEGGVVPHVSYSGLDRARYTFLDGGSWETPVTASGADTSCQYTSIALDSSGDPHVSYYGYDGSEYRIRYNRRDGAAWADPETASGSDSYLAGGAYLGLDSGARAFVSYPGNYRIRGNDNTAGYWEIPANVSAGDSDVKNPFMVMNPAYDRPGVSYTRGSDIRYVRHDPPPPEVGSVSPSATERGRAVNLRLRGTGFRPGAAVRLEKAGESPIAATGLVVNPFTRIDCTVDIPPGCAIGAWDVVVQNDDFQTGALAGGFRVEYATPTLTGVSPGSGELGETVRLEISGTGFRPGAAVSFTRPGSSVILVPTDVVVISAGRIACTLYLPDGIQMGRWDLTVGNDDGKSATLARAFTVKGVSPRIIGIYPTSGTRASTLDVEINGENTDFSSKESVATFSGKGICVNSTTVITSTRAIANITIDRNAPLDARDVNVVTGKQTPRALRGAFQVKELGSTWYLAEGSTGGNFETWILIQNPGDTTATVSLSYHTEAGPVDGPAVELPPRSRLTVNMADRIPNTWSASTVVESDQPVVCERSMYWGNRTGGHNSIGVTTPRDTWYLAEGSTGGGFETWVLVQNPGTREANVTLTYMSPEGPVEGPTIELAPGSRRTVNVADAVPGTWSVSTVVESDGPVIAERAMYWGNRTGGHDSIGVTEPSRSWFLAEGSTAGDFETWVLVQNPGVETATADISHLVDGKIINGATLRLAPGTRQTVNVADTAAGAFGVSTVVSSDLPVIAERAMYWKGRVGGHDSIGVNEPSCLWFLPEGSTAGVFETWVVVLNPGGLKVNTDIIFMSEFGPVGILNLELGPLQRVSLNLYDHVPGYSGIATIVSTSSPVVCEHSMYWGDRVGGNNSMGFSF